ncbi:hypothetical protein [Herbiconiux solani]|uniref:hypothetical protein n=1 Tax=Herbiconiux solani TaxID=661329 RepID=UPI0008243068|nr:hypothetical protein [Herbiconiux solani]
MTEPFSRDELAAISALVIEVVEETPLWSVTGAFRSADNHTVETDQVSGWRFASWVYGHLIRSGLAECSTRDTWASQLDAPPTWAGRAMKDRDWLVLDTADALDLLGDVIRWNGPSNDSNVQLISIGELTVEHALEVLRPFAGSQPPLGADEPFIAEQRRLAQIGTTSLNKWFIFPRPSE